MITTRKQGKIRSFYKNGQKIAHYDLEDDKPLGIKANIYLEGRDIKEGISSLGIWQKNFKNYSAIQIRTFLRSGLGRELARVVLREIKEDFRFFGEKKVKVVFT